MSKPLAKRTPSDDCIVTVDGVDYALHEGEWVDVVPAFSAGDLRFMRQIVNLQTQVDAAENPAQAITLTADTYEELTGILSRRIVTWNWTDDQGQALPQPNGNAAAFATLRLEELLYLSLVIRGESPGGRKNALKPSRTSRSGTRTSRQRAARA
jgi:hypothetical protein